jgi:hypothetical protein
MKPGLRSARWFQPTVEEKPISALALSGVKVRMIDQRPPDAVGLPAVVADLREHG